MSCSNRGVKPCLAYNTNGCAFAFESGTFDYEISDTGRVNVVQNKNKVWIHAIESENDDAVMESCTEVNTLGITLGVFGAVLLLGILVILAFKAFQIMSYRRECAKFDKLVAEAKYAANQTPNDIYRSPVTTFKNPMYGKEGKTD